MSTILRTFSKNPKYVRALVVVIHIQFIKTLELTYDWDIAFSLSSYTGGHRRSFVKLGLVTAG